MVSCLSVSNTCTDILKHEHIFPFVISLLTVSDIFFFVSLLTYNTGTIFSFRFWSMRVTFRRARSFKYILVYTHLSNIVVYKWLIPMYGILVFTT